jgi:hypothetical protein
MILRLKTLQAFCVIHALSPRWLRAARMLSSGRCHPGGVPAVLRKPSRGRDLAFLFAVLGILCCGVARAQIAPGPLSPAHAHLQGIIKCASCHDLLSSSLKCFGCHTEIRRRVEAGTGYHSHTYKKSAGTLDCARCHAEHRGPGSAFVPLDRTSFDHGVQTGFVLEGRHREQPCENCHSAARIESAARLEIKIKDLNRSFLGLRRECRLCHQEPHQGQLGANCLSCHSPEGWRPASRFSHSRTVFPLTGMHQQVPCEKCHARGNAASAGKEQPPKTLSAGSPSPKILLFKGLLFSHCNNCHAEQHRFVFRGSESDGRCERCHDTGGFKNSRLAKGFDHGLTKFPLVGKHADLPCGKCHKPGNMRPVARQLCRGCHEDPHKGQFAVRAGSSDCSMCHSPTNFAPSLFDRTAHARGVFPLAGKHLTLPCARCHQPGGRETAQRNNKRACSECHSEPHGDEFASEPYNNRCELCHAEAGSSASTFTVERHVQTRFPLEGRHAEVACAKCHKPPVPMTAKTAPEMTVASFPAAPAVAAETSATSNARVQFRFNSRACNGCHSDPHGINPASLPCETCHTPQQWKAVLPFDHSRVQFKLEGVHREAANTHVCAKCHGTSTQGDGTAAGAALVFSGISIQCAGCHAEKEPHGGQFGASGDKPRDCSSCHSPKSWNIRTFDHSRTRFALSGAHSTVNCTQCHKEQRRANGGIFRLYRDTPFDCLKCH